MDKNIIKSVGTFTIQDVCFGYMYLREWEQKSKRRNCVNMLNMARHRYKLMKKLYKQSLK